MRNHGIEQPRALSTFCMSCAWPNLAFSVIDLPSRQLGTGFRSNTTSSTAYSHCFLCTGIGIFQCQNAAAIPRRSAQYLSVLKATRYSRGGAHT